MRQAASSSTLDFVSLARHEGHVSVTIDTEKGVAVGFYELVLESFDENSKVYSTLRTDTIKITVYAFTIKDSTLLSLKVGELASWRLYEKDELEEVALAQFYIEYTPKKLQDSIKYDAARMSFDYSGESVVSKSLVGT